MSREEVELVFVDPAELEELAVERGVSPEQPDETYDRTELLGLVQRHALEIRGERNADLLLSTLVCEETLQSAGSRYGIQRARVFQIKAKMLRLLRHPSRTRFYRPFLQHKRAALRTGDCP